MPTKGEKQREAKGSKEENRGQQLQSSFTLLEHLPKSIFYMLYTISKLRKSRIQRSNRVRFGAEMRKIWPSEDNCIKLRDNFARWKSRCEIPQSKVWEFRTPQTKVRNWNSNVRIFPCFCRLHTRSFLLDIFV